ncbi:PREDICTED: protein eyes shut homolog [Myotis brandtii]|uniref:protein eyes shut homolog n=1 Tax=Myotis brandtii TaxID=109478 RepID=UPI0003BB6F67|nr:PREDICTED: protein eyes shut homolog [Myotis brandtii]
MTNKSIMLLSLLALHCMFINGKTTCKWQLVEEWHAQPSSYVVNWTVTGNICMDAYGDCWFEDINTKMSTSGNLAVPQICPLKIQLGDNLVISSEPSLHSPELNLMNVSEASFIDYLQNTTAEEQLLFGCKLKGMHTVNSQWLTVGTHYFITVMASGPSLCQLGLRLNVTVKEQFCQEYLNSEYCSGHGKCLTEIWSKTYNCHCETPFSGKYCQEVDACSYKPCKNNGSCINKREKWNEQGYECLCPPPCPFCEESMGRCVSWSCWKRGICQNESSAYICECAEGFLNQDCEIDDKKCSLIPCHKGNGCNDISNVTICICAPILTGKLCKRLQTSCDSFPCKNNATYINCEKDYHCSCMPRFTGKSCEKVIDHCRLLSIDCLNEGWCFNIIGRFRVIYMHPGCARNPCWFLKNVRLILLYPCYGGSISHDICQTIVPHSLKFKYVSQLGFTGSFQFSSSKTEVPKMCANGCICLTEEGNKGYFYLFIPRSPGKMYLENTTDYQESQCQLEAIYEDEFNISRYLYIILCIKI